MYKYTHLLSESYRDQLIPQTKLHSFQKDSNPKKLEYVSQDQILLANHRPRSIIPPTRYHEATADQKVRQKNYDGSNKYQTNLQFQRKLNSLHPKHQSNHFIERENERPIVQRQQTSFHQSRTTNRYSNINQSANSSFYLQEKLDKSQSLYIPPSNKLQNRLKKLDDLGQRHQNALRQVDLQNKLKSISNKYSEKQKTEYQSSFQKYKRQMYQQKSINQSKIISTINNSYVNHQNQKQNKVLYKEYSFNTLPQLEDDSKQKHEKYKQFKQPKPANQLEKPYSPRNMMNQDISRHGVRQIIDQHLRISKENKTKFQDKIKQSSIVCRNKDYIKVYQNNFKVKQAVGEQSDSKTVEKLTSLQDRIKNSIKPYINT